MSEKFSPSKSLEAYPIEFRRLDRRFSFKIAVKIHSSSRKAKRVLQYQHTDTHSMRLTVYFFHFSHTFYRALNFLTRT